MQFQLMHTGSSMQCIQAVPGIVHKQFQVFYRQFKVMYTVSSSQCTQAVSGNVHMQFQAMYTGVKYNVQRQVQVKYKGSHR